MIVDFEIELSIRRKKHAEISGAFLQKTWYLPSSIIGNQTRKHPLPFLLYYLWVKLFSNPFFAVTTTTFQINIWRQCLNKPIWLHSPPRDFIQQQKFIHSFIGNFYWIFCCWFFFKSSSKISCMYVTLAYGVATCMFWSASDQMHVVKIWFLFEQSSFTWKDQPRDFLSFILFVKIVTATSFILSSFSFSSLKCLLSA